MILTLVLVCILSVLLLTPALSITLVDHLQTTPCHEWITETPSVNRLFMQLLPGAEFFRNIENSLLDYSNIVLVDVDRLTWNLMINHAASWRNVGSNALIYAIAYDDDVCDRINMEGVLCYYDSSWVARLVAFFEATSGHPPALAMQTIMLGRMTTSAATVCLGFNTFLTDTDIFFYRNPFDHILREADIMITATTMSRSVELSSVYVEWCGNFYAHNTSEYVTLNNGVVYYRATEQIQLFLLSLAASSEVHIKGGDPMMGFLQIVFNRFMNSSGLQLHRYRLVIISS